MKVSEAIKGYIIDVRTRGRKEGTTIRWYEQKLGKFAVWLSEEEEHRAARSSYDNSFTLIYALYPVFTT